MSNEESGSSLTELLGSIFAQASSGGQTSTSSASTSAAADPVEPLLSLIRRARAHVQGLSLISANDTIDDLPTSSLRTVLLDSIYAQVRCRSHTRPGDFGARKDVLRQSKDAYRTFLSQLVSLGILNPSSPSSYVSTLATQAEIAIKADRSPIPEDATNRRASKIAAMKMERLLTSVLDDFRRRFRAKRTQSSAVRSAHTGMEFGTSGTEGTITANSPLPDTAYDLLILPRTSKADEDGDEDDNGEVDEAEAISSGYQSNEAGISPPSTLRAYLIILCRLHALQALSALDSIYTEMQLLDSMPPQAERELQERAGRERAETERRRRQGGDENDDWRLDQRWGVSNNSPILDDKGKPLRPFTILPGQGNSGRNAAGLGTAQGHLDARRRLQAQVFQPSHRLPTMTIDDYLAEEERRGNIIQGGGQASADRPTNKEMLALRAEGEAIGTREAEEAEEERRQKAIEWDEFTEANPKGAGNTMNRG